MPYPATLPRHVQYTSKSAVAVVVPVQQPRYIGDDEVLILVRSEIESYRSHGKWTVRVGLLLTGPLHFFRDVAGPRTRTRRQGGCDDESHGPGCSHFPCPSCTG